MNGRQETNAAVEARTMSEIKDYPVIVDYYYSLVNSTARTKEAYCRYVRDYFLYLKETGFDTNSFYSFSNVTMGDINKYMASDSMRFYNKKGVKTEMSGAIRRVRFLAVKSFYEYLVDYDYINASPCDRIKAPKDTKQRTVVYMTKDEIEDVRFKIRNDVVDRKDSILWSKRNLLILNLGCRTGLRESAIAEINVSDIDFAEKKIAVTEKGNVSRDVYIGDETIEMIKDWLVDRERYLGKDAEKCDALFISNRKKRISTCSIYVIITEATKDLDKHISPHKMRSTCAVNTYQNTGDIYLTADQLGHKNVQNTKKYVTVSQKQRMSVASMLDKL